MNTGTATKSWHGNACDTILRLADSDGSGVHPYLRQLLKPNPSQRMLSDAVHALCIVHGRQPGMIDEALAHGAQPEAKPWFEQAAEGFAAERAYLANLTAAVGPLPSTPGQAESEAALTTQRHTLEMLAQSDRNGCATGAVVALLCDWRTIRGVLDAAAHRFAVAVPVLHFPAEVETASMIGRLGSSAATERAMAFGAQQLFAQHRGLWTLLEARASARGDL